MSVVAYSSNSDAELRQQFAQSRAKGMRAKEAAQACGVTEGVAMLAHLAHANVDIETLPAQTPLCVFAVKSNWVELLRSLEACGPLMGLTRNDAAVHDKTGVYHKISGNEVMGLAVGEDIDLRMFFKEWKVGLVVVEPSDTARPKMSLQFFDERGVAIHKVFAVKQTQLGIWEAVLASWIDAQPSVHLDASLPIPAKRKCEVHDPGALAQDWSAMTDTHQFFALLKKHDVERLPAFRSVLGQFTRRVANTAVSQLLDLACIDAVPIMVFVGNRGCIQIHSGPVKRVQPMDIHGGRWLNVLDLGFNLHLREDMISECWVVNKPTVDGVVTSLEVFDAQGDVIAMFFGERKPGAPELESWRDVLAQIPTLATT